MKKEIESKKCKNHPNKVFEFYCFEDSSFLCSKCFLEQHRTHNVDVIDNLKENVKFFEKMNRSNVNLKDFFSSYKKGLEKAKKGIEDELVVVNKCIEKLNSNSAPTPTGNKSASIFELSYNEYKSISEIFERIKKKNEIEKSLSEIVNEFSLGIKKIPTIFRDISNEVKVLENSKIHEDSKYSVDVMLGKKEGDYTLFRGINNHYLVLDLGDLFFLKSIKINTCVNYECILKSLKVSIKNENDIWEEMNTFICEKYAPNVEFQDLTIMKEARYLRLDLLDNWGSTGGDFILIKRILFEVGDLI